MKALLYKDFFAAKKAYLLLLALILILAAYFYFQDAIYLIPILLGVFPIFINASSFAIDEQCHFPVFAFSSPISRSAYVASKFFLPVLSALLAFGCSLVCFGPTIQDSGLVLLAGALLIFFVTLISAIQIPLLLQFGSEKGRHFIFFFYFFIFFFPSMFAGRITLFLQDSLFAHPPSQTALTLIALGILLLSFLMLALSFSIGKKLIDHKEY